MSPNDAGAADRRPPDADRIRIAWFLMVHHKLETVRAGFESIYNQRDLFLIHVDANAPDTFAKGVAALARERPNVRLLPPRRLCWGSWDIVAVELAAIRAALDDRAPWTHFQNVSGQCLAIRPREALAAHMAARPGVNFIDAEPAQQHRAHPGSREQLDARIELRFRGRVRPTRWRLPPPVLFRFNWKGSQWHMLTRAFCEWLGRAPLARYVALYCRPLIVPDELYFQQMVMNGPFASTRADSLHHVIWGAEEPEILTAAHIDALCAGGRFFARKIDVGVDDAVVRALSPAARSGDGAATTARPGRGPN